MSAGGTSEAGEMPPVVRTPTPIDPSSVDPPSPDPRDELPVSDPLPFERPLRAGPYTLVLKLEDLSKREKQRRENVETKLKKAKEAK